MDEMLEKLQAVQIEILDIIDVICKKYGLRYSLYAGTLLGAVRHRGFIPWDDDLDICMPRDDYDKFIELWPSLNLKGYILQNKDNTPEFTQSFTKIRKDKTCFLQSGEKQGKYHTGIFVDIFPIDRIPVGKLRRTRYIWDCMKYQLYTREFVPSNENIVVKAVSKLLLMTVAGEKRKVKRKKLEEKIVAFDKDKKLDIVFVETMATIKQVMPADLISKFTFIQFGNKKYMCFKMWEEYLTIKYGAYMKMPPKEERIWKHQPLMINFENNYEDLFRKTDSVR